MQSLFQHILCPVDFTDKNTTALDVVYAMLPQSRITLLHVIERIEYAEDEETQRFYAGLEKKAHTHMGEMAERFVAADRPIETHIIYGRRGPEIVRYAIDGDVDLVVLSSHKIDREQLSGGWATLSYQVSILCPCPVLLVK